MNVLMRIKRYDPDRDSKPYWAEFRVEVDPIDRLLDALNKIKWTMDGTLTYRRSCAHGVCGSDAMRINGRNRLACKVLMRDVGSRATIEPMLGFPVIRDLVVDMDAFFDKYKSIKPYLINYDNEPGTERLQSPEQRAIFDEGTKCILCGGCTSSCPSSGAIPTGWVRLRLSTRTASSSIAATRVAQSAWAFWLSARVCGAAARSSTAATPAHAASRSRT
jgi:succinate dehydrogenase / fumarate reductase, iron-sulfur subunit